MQGQLKAFQNSVFEISTFVFQKNKVVKKFAMIKNPKFIMISETWSLEKCH